MIFYTLYILICKVFTFIIIFICAFSFICHLFVFFIMFYPVLICFIFLIINFFFNIQGVQKVTEGFENLAFYH